MARSAVVFTTCKRRCILRAARAAYLAMAVNKWDKTFTAFKLVANFIKKLRV
jgi:hypothetical protein